MTGMQPSRTRQYGKTDQDAAIEDQAKCAREHTLEARQRKRPGCTQRGPGRKKNQGIANEGHAVTRARKRTANWDQVQTPNQVAEKHTRKSPERRQGKRQKGNKCAGSILATLSPKGGGWPKCSLQDFPEKSMFLIPSETRIVTPGTGSSVRFKAAMEREDDHGMPKGPKRCQTQPVRSERKTGFRKELRS